MTELTHSSLYQFLKRFQFRGGSLRQFRLQRRQRRTVGTVVVVVLDIPKQKKVRLKLTIPNVEEYRFQRRPGATSAKLKHVQFGFFGAFTYLNLDAFPEDGPPKVMDFRASDCFIAGTALYWEELPAKPKSA